MNNACGKLTFLSGYRQSPSSKYGNQTHSISHRRRDSTRPSPRVHSGGVNWMNCCSVTAGFSLLGRLQSVLNVRPSRRRSLIGWRDCDVHNVFAMAPMLTSLATSAAALASERSRALISTKFAVFRRLFRRSFPLACCEYLQPTSNTRWVYFEKFRSGNLRIVCVHVRNHGSHCR